VDYSSIACACASRRLDLFLGSLQPCGNGWINLCSPPPPRPISGCSCESSKWRPTNLVSIEEGPCPPYHYYLQFDVPALQPMGSTRMTDTRWWIGLGGALFDISMAASKIPTSIPIPSHPYGKQTTNKARRRSQAGIFTLDGRRVAEGWQTTTPHIN